MTPLDLRPCWPELQRLPWLLFCTAKLTKQSLAVRCRGCGWSTRWIEKWKNGMLKLEHDGDAHGILTGPNWSYFIGNFNLDYSLKYVSIVNENTHFIGRKYDSQRKFHGGNSELRTFTFSLVQRSLCPVGTCVKRSMKSHSHKPRDHCVQKR